MSSIYSESGIKRRVSTGANKAVFLKVNSSVYKDYFMKVGQTSKNVMLAILKYMDDDTNLIYIGGDTLVVLSEHSGYNEQVIRNQLRKLHPLLEKTSLRGEYIVNPVFAVKGNEELVWKSYEMTEKEFKYEQQDS